MSVILGMPHPPTLLAYTTPSLAKLGEYESRPQLDPSLATQISVEKRSPPLPPPLEKHFVMILGL